MRLALWPGEVHSCPYLAAREARLGWIDPRAPLTQALYSSLLAAGCRRSGQVVYRPCCPGCWDCIPVRLPVQQFSPNRTQRRTWKQNADTAAAVQRAELGAEHYDLYRRYQRARHWDGAMAEAGPDQVQAFLRCSWLTTWFIEFRRESRLVAVAAADVVDDGLSAVYTFYDPAYSAYGLGVYAILHMVDLGRRLGLRWVYLGYWIGGSRKMSYKQQFRPLDARVGDRWIRVDRGAAMKFTAEDVV